MRMHIVATPRSGGTALAHYLSEKHNVEFYNEPYQPDFLNKQVDVYGTKLGGKILHTSYVGHSIVSQYLSYNEHNADEQVIILERKDKWAQLISYIIMWSQVHISGIHNYSFKEPTIIQAEDMHIEMMFKEWELFEFFKSKNLHHQHLYYEDLVIHSTTYIKNSGYDNILIKNIEYLTQRYNDYLSKLI